MAALRQSCVEVAAVRWSSVELSVVHEQSQKRHRVAATIDDIEVVSIHCVSSSIATTTSLVEITTCIRNC